MVSLSLVLGSVRANSTRQSYSSGGAIPDLVTWRVDWLDKVNLVASCGTLFSAQAFAHYGRLQRVKTGLGRRRQALKN